MKEETKHEPEWAERAERCPSKPNWVDKVPHLLWQLGEKFFPIPPRRKGWDYPHHFKGYRYHPTSEVLNAYLETGFGYGIVCGGDLAVVDIDERAFEDQIKASLPDTALQITGSREGTHLFFKCPGLNTRQILYYEDTHECSNDEHTCWEDEDGVCRRMSDWSHLGEIKCDPHGYVIGPGSVHPSGEKYGPLEGDSIVRISKEDLLDAVDGFLKPKGADRNPYANSGVSNLDGDFSGGSSSISRYEFYELSANDVLPWLSPEERVAHPVHGSDTGTNFMKNDDGETFTCWRHDYGGNQGCGLNAQQFLAVSRTKRDCDVVRRYWGDEPELHWHGWLEAVKRGLVGYGDIPYKVALGHAISIGMVDDDDAFKRKAYWDSINSIKYRLKCWELLNSGRRR